MGEIQKNVLQVVGKGLSAHTLTSLAGDWWQRQDLRQEGGGVRTRTWRAEARGHGVLKLPRHPCPDSQEAVGALSGGSRTGGRTEEILPLPGGLLITKPAAPEMCGEKCFICDSSKKAGRVCEGKLVLPKANWTPAIAL